MAGLSTTGESPDPTEFAGTLSREEPSGMIKYLTSPKLEPIKIRLTPKALQKVNMTAKRLGISRNAAVVKCILDQSNPELERLLTLDEAAEYLACSKMTIRRRIDLGIQTNGADGIWPAYQVGGGARFGSCRIPPSSIKRFLENNIIGA